MSVAESKGRKIADQAQFGREVTEFIRAELVGTPFLHQGRVPGPGGGIDCLGVPIAIAREFGIPYEDDREYDHDVDGSEIEEKLARYLERVDPHTDEIREGDLILFWVSDPTNPQHFGVKVGDDLFAHVREHMHANGRVRETTLNRYWSERIYSVWRFPWQP